VNADNADQHGSAPEPSPARVDKVCARFEAAWKEVLEKGGPLPQIEDYLPAAEATAGSTPAEAPAAVTPAPPSAAGDLLMNLVMTDLEYRWRFAGDAPTEALRQPAAVAKAPEGPGQPPSLPGRPRLEDYIARYPGLGPMERLPEELILDEYRIRHLHGDRPGHEEYVSRFGGLHAAIGERLAQVDQELARIAGPPPVGPGSRVRYFGDYELLEEIGRGGMGVVYRARQRSLDRLVAVKMIQPRRLSQPQSVERFYREARAAANLQHPNIVRIYEVGEHEGQHYFSMDYVAGQSLAQAAHEKTLDPARAARYIQKVAAAIDFAHGHGIVHRALKPSNILVDEGDEPRITDFGLAKRFSEDDELSREGQIVGTLPYMPPEQAEAKRAEVGPASDIYALGATLYRLLAGRPPFLADTDAATLAQVLHAEPLPPSVLNPAVERPLEAMCLKCLEKDPRDRYQSARQLADELGRYLNNEPLRYTRRVVSLRRLWRRYRQNPLVMGLIGMVAGLFVLVAILAYVAAQKPEPSAAHLGAATYTPEQIRHLEEEARQKQVIHEVVLNKYLVGAKEGGLDQEALARLSLCTALARLYGAQGKMAASLKAQEAAVAAGDMAVRARQAYLDAKVIARDKLAEAKALRAEAQGRLVEIQQDIARRGLDLQTSDVANDLPIPIPGPPHKRKPFSLPTVIPQLRPGDETDQPLLQVPKPLPMPENGELPIPVPDSTPERKGPIPSRNLSIPW
jgi:predicted Ser/Thr protein kinase